MTKTVVGSFESYQEAQAVLNELIKHGFDRNDISLVARHSASNSQSNTSTQAHTSGQSHADTSETGAGAMKGAAAGGAIGGAAGLAIGIAGNIATPGIGAIVAAGPIAAMLTGAGVGAVTGGLVGALSNIGVSEEDASHYAENVRRGGALVIVKTNELKAQAAADIMENHGAFDIDQRAHQWRGQGWKGFDPQGQPYTASASHQTTTTTTAGSRPTQAVTEGEQVLPIIEEELKVGKREVQRGSARVYTRVMEQPVNQQVQLREEHVTVEERPANRPATEAELQQAMQGRTVNVTERGEEAIVKKEARVVGEVVINKETTERTENIRDKVRRTDVKVEETEHR